MSDNRPTVTVRCEHFTATITAADLTGPSGSWFKAPCGCTIILDAAEVAAVTTESHE